MRKDKLSQISIGNQNISRDNKDSKEIKSFLENGIQKEFFNNDTISRKIFDGIHEGILLADSETRKLVYGNTAICKILGYSPDELLSLSISDIHTCEYYKEIDESINFVGINELRFISNVPCIRKDGTVIYVDIKDTKIECEGKLYNLGYFTDITEKKLYEDALKESEVRWKFAIDGSELGLWDWNTTNNKVFYSKKWKEIIGYEEHEIGDSLDEWSGRVHPDDIESCFNDLDNHFKRKTSFYSNEHRILCKDDQYKWIHDRGKVIYWSDDGKPLRVIGTHSDISQRKQFEETLRQERDMFISGSVITFKWKNEDNWPVEYVSPNVKQILGYSADEFIKSSILYSNIVHKDDIAKVIEEVNLFSGNNSEHFEHQPYRLISKDGKNIWVLDNTTIVRDDAGIIKYYLGYIVDITERKIAEEKIEASLKEKEILLKEIHHRVKNNLQVIVSLLSLQEDLITDKSILNIFQDVQSRIRSMSIMYEHMHRTGNFETVDVQNYIDSLVKYLYNIYTKEEEQITLDMDIEPMELDIDTIIPCGLIINELVSNSLKYAFSFDYPGKISISMKTENDNCTLIVADNGIGLPEGLDFDNLKSLGLRLVKIFVKQIKGTLNIIKLERGVQFTILFKKV